MDNSCFYKKKYFIYILITTIGNHITINFDICSSNVMERARDRLM